MATKPDDFDVAFALMMKYKSPFVPLQVVVKDFLPHLNMPQARRKANLQLLPFPAFRLDGSKSDWLVKISDLAIALEKHYQIAAKDWVAMNK